MLKYKYYKKRIPELDFLRGIAILLVLCTHYPATPWFMHMWMGVDLFFVLSGFLVSGLLFKSYQQTGLFNVKRFLVRRGLKIYPSFYLFLFLTAGSVFLVRQTTGIQFTNMTLSWQQLLAEIFYLQNYFPNIWGIDWTLALEEHFYILLAVIFLLIRAVKHPIQFVMYVSLLIMIGTLLLRYSLVDSAWITPGKHIVFTHLRLDSLFFGVFLSCVYRLYLEKLKTIHVGWYFLSLFAGIAALIAWFVFNPGTLNFTLPVGYTIIYLCYGTILFSCMLIREYKIPAWTDLFDRNVLIGAMASIGAYSYNIYLWHVFVIDLLFAFCIVVLKDNILFPYAWRYFVPYLIISIFWGIFIARIVEIPVLKWRDRYYQ